MSGALDDSLPSGLLKLDADDRVVDANRVLVTWLGIDRSEIVGRPIGDFVGPPSSMTGTDPEYLFGLAEVLHADGTRRPVFLAYGDPDADGNRLATVFDATTQRALRERLQSRHGLVERTQKRLELVISASIAFADTSSESELAEVLAATTAEAYAAEESVVFLLDEDLTFRQVAGTNPLAGVGDTDILTPRAVGLRSVVKISGIEEARAVAPSVADAFVAAGVHAAIIVPIHQGDTPLGILAAFFRHPRQFDEQASPLADALAGQAARAITALRLQQRLEHAAMHDETTGLPNRRQLEQRIELVQRAAGAVRAVLFVDLDGFKNVNDRLGHQVGDQVLREVASRLQQIVRGEDIVARYGGDEFVIVCDVADVSAATALAHRVRENLAAPYEMLSDDLRLGASIGVSVAPDVSAASAIDELVRMADRAMYIAKNAGGDRVEFSPTSTLSVDQLGQLDPADRL